MSQKPEGFRAKRSPLQNQIKRFFPQSGDVKGETAVACRDPLTTHALNFSGFP
jgi:hypothetical protein